MIIELDQNSVREKAYELWIMRGCPIGSELQDWIEAEQLFMRRRLRYGLKEIRLEAD